MTFTYFFQRLFFHIVAAASIWLFIGILLERLIPGFVLPFVDLPFAALLLSVGGFVCIWNSERSVARLPRLLALIVLGVLVVGICAIVFLRLLPIDGQELIAVFSGCVLMGLTLYAFALE